MCSGRQCPEGIAQFVSENREKFLLGPVRGAQRGIASVHRVCRVHELVTGFGNLGDGDGDYIKFGS